ncbi:MAG: hypothetical protein PVF85_10330 [Anaerolineales bacterium]
MRTSIKRNSVRVLALAAGSSLFGMAHAVGGQGNPQVFNPNSDAITITNSISDVDGAIGGFVCPDGTVTGNPMDPCGIETILYPISGPVYATMINPSTGETMGAVQERGTVNATPAFDVSFFGLAEPDWSVLPATLPWTMDTFEMSIGGSTFEIIEGMELTGRAFPGLGPVEDPMVTGLLALRMAGCAGVRETTGMGSYANKVGSLCLNGTFTFQPDFVGTGVSNCTIVLHDPLQ